MNKFETIQDLIAHLSKLPKDVRQSPVITPRGVPDSDFMSLADTSFMYVDKEFESGTTDEVWAEEDLIGSAETDEEREELLAKFKKVLVLWFD